MNHRELREHHRFSAPPLDAVDDTLDGGGPRLPVILRREVPATGDLVERRAEVASQGGCTAAIWTTPP
jgi:hypothetical protein